MSGRLKYGVAINDSPYPVLIKRELARVNGKRVRETVWVCPYHQTWSSMLSRCYSKSGQPKLKNYEGCEVHPDWLRFTNFRSWMEQQDHLGKHLDKDLKGNGKLYGPDSCVFLTSKVNKFLVNDGVGCEIRGVYKILNNYVAKGKDPFGKSIHLGTFISENEAYLAYLNHKLERVHEFYRSGEICNKVYDILIERYSNKIGETNG